MVSEMKIPAVTPPARPPSLAHEVLVEKEKIQPIHFSLVLATTARTEEPRRFLASLDAQTYRNFELIVVDQNQDDRLTPILAPYTDKFPILHLKSENKGVSRARNQGLDHAGGDVVAFPDDDCLYPPELLARVARFLDDHPEEDGLTGRSIDETGKDSNGRYDTHPGPVNKLNAWRRGIEYAIFLRAGKAKGLRFDEAVGPGAGTAWGCGEGTDYLLRLLSRRASLSYDPELTVLHHSTVPPYDSGSMRKAYAYGRGVGSMLKRHRYPPWFKANLLIRPFGGAILSLLGMRRAEAEYRWNTFRGRLRGLL